MVARVGDDEIAPPRQIKRARAAVKLAVAVAVGSDDVRLCANERNVPMVTKPPNLIVARVGDHEIPTIHNDGHGAFKRAGAVALRDNRRRARTGNNGAVAPLTEREGMGAVGIEGLDSMVARVGDDEVI